MEDTEIQPEKITEEQLKVSFFDKIKPHKFKILGAVLGVFVFAGAVFGAYKLGQKQVRIGPQPTSTPGLVVTTTPTLEVTIATDKTEYEQGEEVKVTLKNMSPKHIWYWQDDKGWFTIQRMEKETWSAIEKYDPCICGASCEPPGFFELENEIWHTWLQEESCMRNQVAKGKYRAEVRIKINEDTKIIYSNEFTIREKEFSKSECKEKPDGTSCSAGLWYDELGRACGGQSCVGLGLGKCYKEECIYLEEYENLSKNPQTNCGGSCRCMKECNEKGPTFFIPGEGEDPECSVNSINKICCCSGV